MLKPTESFIEQDLVEQKEQLLDLFSESSSTVIKTNCVWSVLEILKSTATTEPKRALEWGLELQRRLHDVFSDELEIRFAGGSRLLAQLHEAFQEVTELLSDLAGGLKAA